MSNGSIAGTSNRIVSEQLHQDRMRRRERRAELGMVDTRGGGSEAGGGGVGVDGRPGIPDIPEFELPEYDEGAVSALTQKIAAPRVRTLRETTREAITRRGPGYENPNVRRMTVRQALQGYGTGLEGIISGSRKGAVAEYGQKYGEEVGEARLNYQTKVSTTMAQYGNLWKEYLSGLDRPSAGEKYTSSVGGGGFRVDPNYRPPPGLPPEDPNDPEYIGTRRIGGGGTTGPVYGTPS